MPLPSASYSITMRLHIDTDPKRIGQVTTTIGESHATVVAVDMVEARSDSLTIDVTVNASDSNHAEELSERVDSLEGVHVHNVSDRTFLMHLGGKLEVNPTVPLRTRDDLSMAYTPGVARVSRAIAADPAAVRHLSVKRNSVAVVSDGSAVLGLGDVGPDAALPVMEGKAALFKQFAGVDGWPMCLDTDNADDLVRAVEMIAPGFGGINLEDIAAPRCFEVEERLKDAIDIPVFHDDQHGTAIVVLAALENALRVVHKKLPDSRVIVCGAGAAGAAIVKMLQAEGAGEIVVYDRLGALYPGCELVDESQRWIAENTNQNHCVVPLREGIGDADVFIGVSAPNLLQPTDIATMADDAIVFALANPDSEVDPVGAREHAAVVATGRSDEPNQINNVLAFPGVFRGALDAEADDIDQDMEIAAARALAGVIPEDELNANYIIPSVFNPDVAPTVADAVERAGQRKSA